MNAGEGVEGLSELVKTTLRAIVDLELERLPAETGGARREPDGLIPRVHPIGKRVVVGGEVQLFSVGVGLINGRRIRHPETWKLNHREPQ